jgi:putative glutamine amidotransferase
MTRPVIGISCYSEPSTWGAWADTVAAVIPRQYIDSVESQGGAAILLPPVTNAESASATVDRIDGLVLVGGADINPADYGQDAHETVDKPRLDRDATERALYRHARAIGIPVLGICRGLQIMAVESGGSLIQDLPSAGYGELHRIRPAHFLEHGARFTPGSLVARLLQTTETVVNSSHHQAVDNPGSLTITGWAQDGTVEVCEDPEAAFVIGVQWHPEMSDDRRLFAGLIEAAHRRAWDGA